MQDHEQISGKIIRAPEGFGFEGDSLVPIVAETPRDTAVEIFKLLDEFEISIPAQQKTEFSDSLNFILDGHGDDHREDFVSEFLRMMTAGATVKQVGQRMIALAYLAGKLEVKTHCELARLLNVSPGRVTQIIRELPSDLSALCSLKSRTAKAQAIGER